jgi:hypothetical protein
MGAHRHQKSRFVLLPRAISEAGRTVSLGSFLVVIRVILSATRLLRPSGPGTYVYTPLMAYGARVTASRVTARGDTSALEAYCWGSPTPTIASATVRALAWLLPAHDLEGVSCRLLQSRSEASGLHPG